MIDVNKFLYSITVMWSRCKQLQQQVLPCHPGLSGMIKLLLDIQKLVQNRGLKHAGRMWPARCICAAREHLKKCQEYIIFDQI